ncbi:MAG TPA: FAD-dependent oxidoreductase, partial [Patescibacteria group bacterium]|nr:FAD-dependent oxidoreductase [Patescibacteria group bacterium]
MLELLIIGASAAGSSAAIYAAREKLNFKIIAKETGGEIATSGEVNNFPGWGKTNGQTISKKFQDHLEIYNINPDLNLTAQKIKIQPDNSFKITAKKQTIKKEYKAKSVIVATGMKPRRLKVPGEKKFRGKGISYCTVCDGPLFKGKSVAVIGGGESALESAIMLKDIAKKV